MACGLGVKTTGCSGLAYKLEYADEVADEDLVFEDRGVKVLIDPKSLPYLEGTQLDFRARRPERGLQVPQPQGKGPLRLRRVVPRLMHWVPLTRGPQAAFVFSF